MTHFTTCARLLTALAALSLLATSATALPGGVSLPAIPVSAAQDIQTPVGGATAGFHDGQLDACAHAAAPALPLPLPVSAPGAKACAQADLNEASAGIQADAGMASIAAGTDAVDVAAGPVHAHTENPVQAFLGWLTHLF